MSLIDLMSIKVKDIFEKLGYESKFGRVIISDRQDLSQFQCNGALIVGKMQKVNPMSIAKEIMNLLRKEDCFDKVNIIEPGFINIDVSDEFLVEYLIKMKSDNRFLATTENKINILIDYGGPNVGKPLHVGHLRSAIIGESLKRICKFLGHEVISDVHLGDWGLQMGMIIAQLEYLHPEWPYFRDDFEFEGICSSDKLPEISLNEFEVVYKEANEKYKRDENFMRLSKSYTYSLQSGHIGLRTVWRMFVDISCKYIKSIYETLDVSFDLWKGESDVHNDINGMIDNLIKDGYTVEDNGALIIRIEDENGKEITPLIIQKSDNSYLYATTELATIASREKLFNVDEYWYVTDQRQAFHFKQSFLAAYKTKIIDKSKNMIHIGFGTVNDVNGKPFKTRDGDTFRLDELINSVVDKAKERISSLDLNNEKNSGQTTKEVKIKDLEGEDIAKKVGMAMLKFADLVNNRLKNYVFDMEKFSSFDGKTGVYIVYTLTRIKSLLRKGREKNIEFCEINKPCWDIQRNLMIKITEFADILDSSYTEKAPNHLCEYVYELSSIFNYLYHEHKILSIENCNIRGSMLSLIELLKNLIECILNLLGISAPEKI